MNIMSGLARKVHQVGPHMLSLRSTWIGAVLLALLGSVPAVAGTIVVATDSNIGSATNNTFFGNVFDGTNVVANSSDWMISNWDNQIVSHADSFSIDPGALTDAELAGANWFIATGQVTYSANDIDILSNFLANGGSVWVVGEGSYYDSYNVSDNALLAGLGSSISINLSGNATGAVTIGADPFTVGVTNFDYDYASTILTGGTDIISAGGQGIIAVQRTSSVPDTASTFLLLALGAGAMIMARRRAIGAV